MTVELLWRARRAPGENLVGFAQLLDASGKLAAAEESPPAGGRFPTHEWARGQLVREWRELGAPADLPAGEYPLIVGWYAPADGRRLPVDALWPWTRRDHLALGRIEVVLRQP